MEKEYQKGRKARKPNAEKNPPCPLQEGKPHIMWDTRQILVIESPSGENPLDEVQAKVGSNQQFHRANLTKKSVKMMWKKMLPRLPMKDHNPRTIEKLGSMKIMAAPPNGAMTEIQSSIMINVGGANRSPLMTIKMPAIL